MFGISSTDLANFCEQDDRDLNIDKEMPFFGPDEGLMEFIKLN